jgi:hypothetical protein
MSSSSRFRPHHVERSGDFTLPLPIRHAFPLFSPEGERAWAPGWDPEYLHPDHPSTAPGAIFRTTHGGEETLWLLLQYDPHTSIAHYSRFSPGSRLGTVLVRCEEESPTQTRVHVTYVLTAVAPAGNTVLEAFTTEKYLEMLRDWQRWIVRSQQPNAPASATDPTA